MTILPDLVKFGQCENLKFFSEEMFNPVIFKDRRQAGKHLGQKLKEFNLENPVVLAIPGGGDPVG